MRIHFVLSNLDYRFHGNDIYDPPFETASIINYTVNMDNESITSVPKSIVITFLLLSISACLSPKAWALIKIPKVIDVLSSPGFSGIGKSSSMLEVN